MLPLDPPKLPPPDEPPPPPPLLLDGSTSAAAARASRVAQISETARGAMPHSPMCVHISVYVFPLVAPPKHTRADRPPARARCTAGRTWAYTAACELSGPQTASAEKRRPLAGPPSAEGTMICADCSSCSSFHRSDSAGVTEGAAAAPRASSRCCRRRRAACAGRRRGRGRRRRTSCCCCRRASPTTASRGGRPRRRSRRRRGR